MSKEQITCTDCGYTYRGNNGVDECPRCEESWKDSCKLLSGLGSISETSEALRRLVVMDKGEVDKRYTEQFTHESRDLIEIDCLKSVNIKEGDTLIIESDGRMSDECVADVSRAIYKRGLDVLFIEEGMTLKGVLRHE